MSIILSAVPLMANPLIANSGASLGAASENPHASAPARFHQASVFSTEKPPFSVVLISQDLQLIRAILTASDEPAQTNYVLRVEATLDAAPDLSPDDILILDTGLASNSEIARNLRSPIIVLVDERRAKTMPHPHEPLTAIQLNSADISATTLETAILNAYSVGLVQNNLRKTFAQLRAAEQGLRARQERFLQSISPLAYGLAGLIEIMRHDPAPKNLETQLGLLEDWTNALIAQIAHQQKAAQTEHVQSVDLAALFEQLASRFEKTCAKNSQTLVVSTPPEPLLIAGDHTLLNEAAHGLIMAALEREGCERRIELLLWRSARDIRLAVIAGPTRRPPSDQTAPTIAQSTPHIREINKADEAFFRAIEDFKAMGATVDLTNVSSCGATIILAFEEKACPSSASTLAKSDGLKPL